MITLELTAQQRVLRHPLHIKPGGDRIVYWMQQAQRANCNPALEYAIAIANRYTLPLHVYFFLSTAIPDATASHYRFMLEGIAETGLGLKQRNIAFHLLPETPPNAMATIFDKATLLVMDHGYLSWQRRWREKVCLSMQEAECRIAEIDTEAVVPIHLASDKEEYSAATLRKKILPKLSDFLDASSTGVVLRKPGQSPPLPDEYRGSFEDRNSLWAWAKYELKLPAETGVAIPVRGSHSEAQRILDSFLRHKLKDYATLRNDPNLDIQSDMSAYLHFGQISPIEIILRVLNHNGTPQQAIASMIADKNRLSGVAQSIAAYAEELIIRRELAMNFCYYNHQYEHSEALPKWAKQSLNDHLQDPREADYSLDRLELGETDDVYWNAAQIQLIKTGKMHNYMRMYWGKRVLAWSPNVEEAYQVLAYLNNKYELDGRDANSWAGIAWCFGKHDRPWANRAIYGMVRFMNAAGLKRKFDMNTYIKRWS